MTDPTWPAFTTLGRDPTHSSGVRRIYLRFILVTLVIVTSFGLGLTIYDVADTGRQQEKELHSKCEMVAHLCKELAKGSAGLGSEELVKQCSNLAFGSEVALLSRKGRVLHQSSPQIAKLIPEVFGTINGPAKRFRIDDALGDLSGAWVVHPFSKDRWLLTVYRRRPADLGTFRYMTIGAGVLAAGIGLTFFVLLVTVRWVLYQPLQRLVDGLTGALARDVERRRKAEERAVATRREAETHLAFLNNLLRASDAGIIATDADGLIRIYNRAAERLLGYAAQEVTATLTLRELEERTQRPAEKELPFVAHPRAEGEELLVDVAGQQHLVALNRSVITDSAQEHLGQLVTFIDITERRRLESELHRNELELLQAAKMASLGEMSTGVAHELNQPLNNIGLLCSRMRKRASRLPNAEEGKFIVEKLKRVDEQVRRASRIIEQMRAFGRRSDTVDLAPMGVTGAISHALEMLRGQLAKEKIELEVELPKDLPRVLGHEGQLEQVLLNLVVNAKDAIAEGAEGWERPQQPRVTIRAREQQNTVEILVIDNGPGMDPETQARIFEPFFTTKQVGHGTGLGLSISYSLARGFGGTLSVESQKGSGTVFTLQMAQLKDKHDR